MTDLSHIYQSGGDSRSRPTGGRNKYVTKVYVVLRRKFGAGPDEDNVSVVAVRLTAQAAQKIVDANVGTFVKKFHATK
jgi:hypothetical protein